MSPRTEASREKRRAYSRLWHSLHPGWRKDWYAKNRERENARKRRWRAENPDKVRAQNARSKRPSRAIPELPPPFIGHPLFEQARAICGSRPFFDRFNRWEDAMSVVVLAILEDEDPCVAYRKFMSEQRRAEVMNGPFFANVDIRDDGKVVYSGRSLSDHGQWDER